MWFRKRPHGIGWQPISWQGWLIHVLALIAIVLASWLLDDVIMFIITLVAIVSTVSFLAWYFSDARA